MAHFLVISPHQKMSSWVTGTCLYSGLVGHLVRPLVQPLIKNLVQLLTKALV